MMFQGFTPAATGFFRDLAADNSKAWFEANRAVFEREVRAPMQALIEDLPDRYRPLKLFRLNRDVRFSSDKRPYKTMLGAVHPRGAALEYLHLDGEGLLVAAGAYMLAPDQITRFREAVAGGPGEALEPILAELRAKERTVDKGGAEALKTGPRGFPPDHPRVELLRWKGLIASLRVETPESLAGPELTDRIVDFWDDAQPLCDWLDAHVGASAAGGFRARRV
jgi:uncharacterized protein (TIGR02453 family)